jgi:S1-C subfamily serine protease
MHYAVGMRAPLSAILALLLTASISAQDTGVLRITVVLTDASGNAIPIPRAQLLISDNPTTNEPRRVRTGANGVVEIKLPAGNYTVESDIPVTFGGRHFVWTQMLDVTAGRDTVLTLTTANADADADTSGATGRNAATHADGAAILNKWQGSLAEIWSPTSHATGFVIDARGLIATHERTLGDATDVEVEFGASAADRVKIPGRVIASERAHGVTIIWVDPDAIRSRPPIAPVCSAVTPAVSHEEKVVALVAPMLEPKNAINGSASHADAQSFRVDWRLEDGTAGGPVFTADGTAIGIAVGQDEPDRARWKESYVIPLRNACPVIAAAEQKMSGAKPPAATMLRTEAGVPRTRMPTVGEAKQSSRLQPPVISAADFDIALVTPPMITGDQSTWSPRSFFGYWASYVTNAPEVLFVRASPQFEESVWRVLARGAAATQGVRLPPMPSFNANFLRMRAFCGGTEVTPIHRFIIEMPVQGRAPIREGLYVFAQADFGTECASVRFELFSQKSPNRADSRTIDPTIFAKIAAASK